MPSGCLTGMPSASCQCSKPMVLGISEPVAKLPGRRLMLTTASNGNSVKASSTYRACVGSPDAPALALAGDDHGCGSSLRLTAVVADAGTLLGERWEPGGWAALGSEP